MDLSKFVAQQNVVRFTDLLRFEKDVSTRQELRRLLVAEENLLGRSIDQLDRVDRQISETDTRIAFQRARVATIESNGRDATAAASLLQNLLQEIYKEHRLRIVDEIERAPNSG